LADLLLKCLQKSKSNRFQDGRQMAAAIETLCNQLQLDCSLTNHNGGRKWPWRLAGAICVAAVVSYGGLQMIPQVQRWLRPPTPTPPPFRAPAQTAIDPPPETAPQGALRVSSLPSGARLYIDGALKGQTPASLALPRGTYTLKLSLADHYEWQAAIQLSQGEELPLSIRLARKE
jgi:hypothetical protein